MQYEIYIEINNNNEISPSKRHVHGNIQGRPKAPDTFKKLIKKK